MMKAVELFAGAGGLGIGVSRAGFKPAAIIEWDRWACDTMRENKARKIKPIANWPIVEGDVRHFDFSALKDIDLVSGGPPCQPFSLGGKHQAYRDDRDMFPYAIKAVRELQPKAFLFENVKGLTRTTFSNYLQYTRLQLRYPDVVRRSGEDWNGHLSHLEQIETSGGTQGLQYNVVIRLLNAANYGVPQRRERVFIVGFRADLGLEWSFPDATHSNEALQFSKWVSGEYWKQHGIKDSSRFDVRRYAPSVEPELLPWRTVRDALHDLPDPELHPRAAAKFADHRFIPGARSYAGHTGSPSDEPAKTLKAGAHGVPGGENMLRRRDGSVRYFSVRESARLQTFPDDFVFHGAWGETMRQLGNAVPVDLAEIVAKSIKAQLPR
jgi:DNA (cytosine-5)-methyltransferase 1